jgi:hypothetical protein
MVLVFLLWAILLIICVILMIYRVHLTPRLEDFSGSHENPRIACDKFDRALFPELSVHSVITLCVLLLLRRSHFLFILFILTLPILVRGWYLRWRGRFYFSLFHVDIMTTRRSLTSIRMSASCT